MNQLISNNSFELNLTIAGVSNGKNYKQKIFIDALQFKGYVNVLKINNEVVEIKHENGDTNINLEPILGYSMISQVLEMTRINDTWYCMSKIHLHYNSNTNVTYSSSSFTHRWSSNDIDIFQQLGFYNLMNNDTLSTRMPFKIAGQSVAVMNGNYVCEWSAYSITNNKPKERPYAIYGVETYIDSGNEKEWVIKPATFNHHIHGGTRISGNIYNVSTGVYDGPSSTTINGYTGFQSQIATNNEIYNGEFASISFPFYLELRRFYISTVRPNNLKVYIPCKITILGSNDDGTTYDWIYTSSIAHNSIAYHDVTMSGNTAKFKKYKLVFEETQQNMWELHVEHIKFYGDVYEAT